MTTKKPIGWKGESQRHREAHYKRVRLTEDDLHDRFMNTMDSCLVHIIVKGRIGDLDMLKSEFDYSKRMALETALNSGVRRANLPFKVKIDWVGSAG
jgi:hypothetical protein